MPVKKSTKPASAAIQQGLNVRTTAVTAPAKPIKASKATARKIAANKSVSTDKPAAAPRKAVKAIRPAVKTPKPVPAADKPLWTDDSDRTTAQRAVVRHINKYNKMSDYQDYAVSGAQSYWAEATQNYMGVVKDAWYLAFDSVNAAGEPITYVIDVNGVVIAEFNTDKPGRYGFTYWD